MAAMRWALPTATNAALFLVSIALHLLLAAIILDTLDPPRQTAPTPTLIKESVEVFIAETESDLPIENPPVAPTSAVAAPPLPELAPYLADDAGAVALPPPTLTVPPPELPLPEFPPPELPLADQADRLADLPEITLPPAEQPLPSQGATARLKMPQLKTDIHTYLRKHYPREARRNHWEGIVTLSISVAEDGSVAEVSILNSSGYTVLDTSALKMMRKARYTSGPATLTQRIEYKLK